MSSEPTARSGDQSGSGASENGLTRTFGWSDMFVRPEDDPRTDGGFTDERTTLTGYLRDYRLTLELKCAGLDAAGLARQSVEPSNLSLLGLVRHLTDVERRWFRQVLDGQDIPFLYRTQDDRDAAFDGAIADPAVVDAAWAAWRAEVSFAEQFVEQAPDLGVSGTYGEGEVISLREVLVHMIEEYARHAGHADLLRERIDGRVGQ
ncbi:MAG TPA: DinB family protein [Streptosporangiaceae bacterium]